MVISYQSVVLFVRDINISKEFYSEILGLEIGMDFGKALSFKEGLSLWEISRDHEIILRYGNVPADTIPNHELYFETDNIGEFEKQIRSRNISKVHTLKEESWGQRTIRILDPDNHIIEVGESLEVFIKRLNNSGMTIEEVGNRTSVPQEVIRKILKG
jgi:catechol 2,3-dioxygenase-like lactoylglutathione lyase family enzyme